MPSFIKSETHITLVFDDGESVTVYNSNDNYGQVCTAIKARDWDAAKELSQPVEIVKKSIKDIEHVSIMDGIVAYDDVPLHTSLTTRILEMHEQGFDVSYMALFLENLMDNPSYRAVNELYNFLEKSDLPITEDGHFLAYKRINGNFTDIHTGSMDNSPGMFVEMRRNQVNEDKTQTCSDGLHFCSREYLPSYGSYRDEYKVVMVKINPRDVVSIPTDYNDSKGRCCKYYVVKELDIDFDTDANLPDAIESPFMDSRIVVSEEAVEQLNLADAVLGAGEPRVIATFESATTAMHGEDIDSSSITKVCNGDRRSAGGFAWRWASDNPANRLETDVDDDEDFDGCFYYDTDEEDDDDWVADYQE